MTLTAPPHLRGEVDGHTARTTTYTVALPNMHMTRASVNLPRLPWDGEAAPHDPRTETVSRSPVTTPKRRPALAEATIATIRAMRDAARESSQ